MAELTAAARAAGLWNLFLPDAQDPAHGLSVAEYAVIAGSRALAGVGARGHELPPPDTGNMEILHMFGTPEHSSSNGSSRCWPARSAPRSA